MISCLSSSVVKLLEAMCTYILTSDLEYDRERDITAGSCEKPSVNIPRRFLTTTGCDSRHNTDGF